MKQFKLPLVVTGIMLALGLTFVIVGATWIHQSSLTNREKELRGERLGTGTATLVCVVIAPFWLVSAAKFGKERRMGRNTSGPATKRKT